MAATLSQQDLPKADPRRWKALALLALVQFIIFLDATIVNVALPSIQRDLGFSEATLTWVVNAYLITAGGLLLLGGRIADLVGRRKVFCLGAGLFAVASATAGLAQNSEVLLAGRSLQGVAEALSAPAAMSMVALLFTDPKERAKAFGIWGGLAGLGSAAGVLLSGVLTDLASWRWVFLVNIPLAVIPMLLLPKLADESRAPAQGRRRPDWLGAVLVTGGLIAILNAVLNAARNGWDSAPVLVPLLVGIAALALFVVVETKVAQPLVPLGFFANRVRATANVATVFVASSSAAVFFLIVLYTQNVLGYSPLASGLAWLPFCVAFMPGLFLSTKLIMKVGPRSTLAAGLAVSAIGVALFTRISVDGSYLTDLLPAMVVTALGFGMTNPAMQNAALHEVSEADAGLGSGIVTTVLQMGSALGLTVFVSLALSHQRGQQAAGVAENLAVVRGYDHAFGIAAGALAVGAVAALVILRGVRPTAPQQVDPAAAVDDGAEQERIDDLADADHRRRPVGQGARG
ncbi:MFS transporter [Micromonospora haikouensis]|uniref:MFS transporter n=1 Tax=Micromonospora haikouensis TaxID=686309 RepID=UPI003D718093